MFVYDLIHANVSCTFLFGCLYYRKLVRLDLPKSAMVYFRLDNFLVTIIIIILCHYVLSLKLREEMCVHTLQFIIPISLLQVLYSTFFEYAINKVFIEKYFNVSL